MFEEEKRVRRSKIPGALHAALFYKVGSTLWSRQKGALGGQDAALRWGASTRVTSPTSSFPSPRKQPCRMRLSIRLTICFLDQASSLLSCVADFAASCGPHMCPLAHLPSLPPSALNTPRNKTVSCSATSLASGALLHEASGFLDPGPLWTEALRREKHPKEVGCKTAPMSPLGPLWGSGWRVGTYCQKVVGNKSGAGRQTEGLLSENIVLAFLRRKAP